MNKNNNLGIKIRGYYPGIKWVLSGFYVVIIRVLRWLTVSEGISWVLKSKKIVPLQVFDFKLNSSGATFRTLFDSLIRFTSKWLNLKDKKWVKNARVASFPKKGVPLILICVLAAVFLAGCPIEPDIDVDFSLGGVANSGELDCLIEFNRCAPTEAVWAVDEDFGLSSFEYENASDVEIFEDEFGNTVVILVWNCVAAEDPGNYEMVAVGVSFSRSGPVTNIVEGTFEAECDERCF